MRLSTFILCIFFLAAGIGITALNSESVHLNYYVSSIEMPLSMLLIVILVIGVIAGALIGIGSIIKLRWENRGLKKKLDSLQAELSKMQMLDIPIEE